MNTELIAKGYGYFDIFVMKAIMELVCHGSKDFAICDHDHAEMGIYLLFDPQGIASSFVLDRYCPDCDKQSEINVTLNRIY
jgi:hypothetical protein